MENIDTIMKYAEPIFFILVIICFIFLFKIGNENYKDFEKWLSQNSTKFEEGYYKFNHDKSGRLYSKTELKNFFDQTKI